MHSEIIDGLAYTSNAPRRKSIQFYFIEEIVQRWSMKNTFRNRNKIINIFYLKINTGQLYLLLGRADLHLNYSEVCSFCCNCVGCQKIEHVGATESKV